MTLARNTGQTNDGARLYKKGVNFNSIEDWDAVEGQNYTSKSASISELGVYEIKFEFSVQTTDATTPFNPHLYVNIGLWDSPTLAYAIDSRVLVRLSTPNTSQNYPLQPAVTVYITNTVEGVRDIFFSHNHPAHLYNINGYIKKVADA